MTATMPVPAHGYRLVLLVGDKDWLTANQRMFWATRGSLTKRWRRYAMDQAIRQLIPPVQHAYVLAELRFPDRRRRDPHNWMPTVKACIDGLVDAGIFPDDSHKFLIGPDLRMGPTVPFEKRGVELFIYPHGGLPDEG